jgi:outer membrane protein assembly factor BamA
MPWQKAYYLGGPSTLRGFRYKAFPNGWEQPGANRMVLAQLEYRLGRDELPDMMDMGILDNFNLILFTDAGWTASVDSTLGPTEGFDDLSIGRLKHDVGIALANHDGNVRFEVARRTIMDKLNVLFRISRPFETGRPRSRIL